MKPETMRSSVDLPQPDGPSSATSSPPAISRLISRTASTSPKRWLMSSRRSRCPRFDAMALMDVLTTPASHHRRTASSRQRQFPRGLLRAAAHRDRVDSRPRGPTLTGRSEGSSGQGAERPAELIPREPFEPDPGHAGEGTGHADNSLPANLALSRQASRPDFHRDRPRRPGEWRRLPRNRRGKSAQPRADLSHRSVRHSHGRRHPAQSQCVGRRLARAHHPLRLARRDRRRPAHHLAARDRGSHPLVSGPPHEPRRRRHHLAGDRRGALLLRLLSRTRTGSNTMNIHDPNIATPKVTTGPLPASRKTYARPDAAPELRVPVPEPLPTEPAGEPPS